MPRTRRRTGTTPSRRRTTTRMGGSCRTEAAEGSMNAEDPDQRIILRIDWKTYERIEAGREESSVPRLAYLDGVMEAVVPGRRRVKLGALIGRLLEVWAT